MTQIRTLVIFNIICLTSMMAFLPVVGPIVRELGMQEWHSGLVVAVSGIFWMLFARIWGRASDQHGRRAILLLATLGYGISYALLSVFLSQALHSTWSLLLVVSGFILLRACIGSFYAAIPPVSAAEVADVTTTEQRTSGMAILGAANGVGMIIGPVLGGIIGQYDLILPLYFAAALPFLACLFVYFGLPKHEHHTPIKSDPIKITDPRLRLPVFSAFLASSSVYTAQICIGFFGLDILNLSSKGAAELSGYAMGAVGVSLIIVQIMVSKLKNVLPVYWLMLGSAVSASGFILVTLWTQPVGLMVSYAIMAAGLGMVFPSFQSLASQAVGEHEQGVAAGSVSSAQGLSMVIAPLVSTFFYEINPFLPFLSAAVLLFLLLSCAFIQFRKLILS